MELIDIIKKRRSIRRYIQKDIPREEIYKIIEAANWAPSACNLQEWRFIIIEDKIIKEQIVKNGAAGIIIESPVGILVLYNNATDRIEYKDNIQSAAAAIQNMLLMASTLNIGACWLGNIPKKSKLRKIFKIPKNYDPIAYITMGYFTEQNIEMPRKNQVEQIISYNKYNFQDKDSPKKNMQLRIKRILKKIYYTIPFKKKINKWAKKYEKKF